MTPWSEYKESRQTKTSLPLAAAKSEIAIFISKIMKYASVQKNEADRKQMVYSHELHWTTKFYKNVLFAFSTLLVILVTKNICSTCNTGLETPMMKASKV